MTIQQPCAKYKIDYNKGWFNVYTRDWQESWQWVKGFRSVSAAHELVNEMAEAYRPQYFDQYGHEMDIP